MRLILRKNISKVPDIQEFKASKTITDEIAEKRESSLGENVYILKAPMTGIFYRAPSPTSPPFVEEGDIVHKGQRIALIEAMKIFNDITAEISGKVVKIFPQNSSLVMEGDPLFAIEPMEELV
ncbi:acetyl-CoA carboxylase, biotin carboxyl carrier protein [bacterium]|nr:acetyl-CoA carboxylase, biotin carboxyl carrier protein [bacterium]